MNASQRSDGGSSQCASSTSSTAGSGLRRPVKRVEVAPTAEQLLDAPERQSGLELAADRGQAGDAIAELLEQRGLADPGRAAHERAPAALEHPAQRGELGFALEQKSQGRSPGGRAPDTGRSCSG